MIYQFFMLSAIFLVACKPVEPSYHNLMLDPAYAQAILQDCMSATPICTLARRVQIDRLVLLRELQLSPTGFGQKIMRAQIQLAQLKLSHASSEKINAQEAYVQELLSITIQAGE